MGPEKGLPGAALAFEEPYILLLDDSARKGSNLTIWHDTHMQSGLYLVYQYVMLLHEARYLPRPAQELVSGPNSCQPRLVAHDCCTTHMMRPQP